MLLEGDAARAEEISGLLGNPGTARLDLCVSLSEALEKLGGASYDVLLLDLENGSAPPIDSYRILHHSTPELPVVLLADSEEKPIVAQALREGAEDSLCYSQLGSPLLVKTIHHAIENKKRREHAWRLLFTLEQIPTSIIMVDFLGNIDFINSRFAELTGYRNFEICGENVNASNLDIMQSALFRAISASMDDKSAREGDTVITTKNGEERWAHYSISPVKNIENAITHYVASIEDVTELRRKEEEIHRSEEKFRTLVQNINEYVYSVTYGEFAPLSTYHSPRCEEITGYTPDEFGAVRDLWYTMIYEADRKYVSDFIDRITKDQVQSSIEHRIVRKNGTVRWVSNTCTARRDNDGAVRGLYGFILDITERKAAEEALRKSEKMLRKRNESMEKDLRLAQMIQRAFLPKKIPVVNGVRIDFRYIPVDKIGGDYFSIAPLGEDSLSVFIGDVSGHGVSAALFLSLVKSATDRMLDSHGTDPARYMAELNNLLIKEMPSYFITAIYGLLRHDPARSSMTYQFTNGGHPYPVHYDAAAKEFRQLKLGGTIVGMFNDATYGLSEVELRKGDRIFLFTDGITETENSRKEMIGFEEGLVDIFRKASRPDLPATLDGIIDEINLFRGEVPINDDIVIIGIEV
jgi:PAS domain S-box-containing protein